MNAVLQSSPAAEKKARILAELDRHPFSEAWWLKGRHAQTVWSVYFRRLPRVDLRLERWETPDGDFLRMHLHDGEPGKPLALLLHGLEGSVESNYMIGMAHDFSELGWSVAAMEFRSCGGELNRAPRLYHTGETADLEFVVGRLIAARPDRPIFISGVSLGGNVTAKWLGEIGDRVPSNVVAASAICPPFDLAVSGPNMDRVVGGAYTKRFLSTLIPKAIEKDKQHPGIIDVEAVRRAKTFAEFDTHATAVFHGFRDHLDYWTSVGCGRFLSGVRRPLLLVASADDPFNPEETLPRELAETHPFLYPQFTRKGGHVGFVYGTSPRHSRHWAEEQVVRFFRLIAAHRGDAPGF